MTKNLDQLREEMRTHAGLGWDHQPVAFEVLEALIERVEAAEAAVQRVREVAVEMANHPMPDAPKGSAWILAEGAQLFAKEVLEALDGGEQE